jgi:hypothetical protein
MPAILSRPPSKVLVPHLALREVERVARQGAVRCRGDAVALAASIGKRLSPRSSPDQAPAATTTASASRSSRSSTAVFSSTSAPFARSHAARP